jgi:hypothetical protein
LDEPQFVVLNAGYSSVKGNHLDKYFSYVLFLSPGDSLVLETGPAKPTGNPIVTGTGSNKNQPGIFALNNMDTRRFKRDTTPERIMAAIEKQNLLNRITLKKYIHKNKPSAAFIANANLNLDYFVSSVYVEFNHFRNFGKPKSSSKKWQATQDSLLNSVNLNNAKALACYNYNNLITEFLDSKINQLWFEQKMHPPLFYKKSGQVMLVGKSFDDKAGSKAAETVIKEYFTGEPAEYLYAELLKKDMITNNYNNFLVTLNHFKRRYPTSKYLAQFYIDAKKIAVKKNEALKHYKV